MPSITISKLQLAGTKLFSDSESYLNELDENELRIQGGLPNFSISLGSCLKSCWL